MPSMNQAGRAGRGRGPSRSRKYTAWRKRRRIGQPYGNRAVPRYLPGANLPSVLPGADTPMLVEDRPHRDFYFPMTGAEVMDRLRQLPSADIAGITHIWMRRLKPNEVKPLGSYHTGPGFRVIVLYPWPRDRTWRFGSALSEWWRNFAREYRGVVQRRRGEYSLTFPEGEVRRFYKDNLIFHEVGHHVDWRPFSRANEREMEEFADQYATKWARRLRCSGRGF